MEADNPSLEVPLAPTYPLPASILLGDGDSLTRPLGLVEYPLLWLKLAAYKCSVVTI